MTAVWFLVEGDRWLKGEAYDSELKAKGRVLTENPEAYFTRICDYITYAYIEGDPHNAPSYTIVKYDVKKFINPVIAKQ